jgi:hypothetical protein
VHDLLEQEANVAKLLLPFSGSAKDRTLPFTDDMEKAIVFFTAESDRKKGEGIILKKPPEELAFISKSCYPIWLVPWKGKNLLFDGLGVSTRTFLYEVLPDVKAFINDIQGSAEKRQAYSAALTDHAHYFQSIKGVEQKTVLGLITSQDFIKDFRDYLITAEEVDESDIKEICLSPIVDEPTISSALNELSELKSTLERDIQSLNEAMKLLSTTTKQHVSVIREETKKIQAELNEKINEANSLAMEKVRRIQERYDARILKTSQRFEKQLQDLHQERVKSEKKEERALSQIERCDAEIQTSRNRRDSSGERRWKEEREKWKRETSTLKKDMEVLNKQIEQTESQKKIEITNIRSEFNAESEEAMKDVRELEAVRDSKTQLGQQETKSLEDSTSTLLAQLDKLTKQKRVLLEELDKMGMREQRGKLALAYVPLYLACFQAADQRRYVVYPPSIVGSMSTMTKFKGMLGVSKAKSLFQQRSKAVTNVMNQLITLIERDPVFKRDLHDAGAHANILQTTESRERIRKGLQDLRNEDWFSANEVQTLSTLLKMSRS